MSRGNNKNPNNRKTIHGVILTDETQEDKTSFLRESSSHGNLNSGFSILRTLKSKLEPTQERVDKAVKIIRKNLLNFQSIQSQQKPNILDIKKVIFYIEHDYIIVGLTKSSKPIVISINDTDVPIKTDFFENIDREKTLCNKYFRKLVVLFKYIFNEILSINPSSCHVLLSDKLELSNETKRIMSSVLLDRLKTNAVTFFPASVATIIISGCISGIVVHIGKYETCVTPILYGYPLTNLQKSTPLGSQYLKEKIKQVVFHEHPDIDNYVLDSILNLLIANSNCEANFNETNHQTFKENTCCSNTKLILKKKEIIIQGYVREYISSCLLFDDNENDYTSIPNVISDVIKSLPTDCKKLACENIVFSGELFYKIRGLDVSILELVKSGLISNTSKEFHAISHHIKTKYTPFNHMITPWFGLSLLDSVNAIKDFLTITDSKQEIYDCTFATLDHNIR